MSYYSKGGGLREWVKQNWVDIANKKSDGSYPKCGRSGGEKRKNYPKCVPIAKARAMSKGQRAGAVRRKQAKANTGPTPSRGNICKKKTRHNEKKIINNHLKLKSISDLQSLEQG